MIIKANNTLKGILDLSALERLQEDNHLEALPFRLCIKPGQLVEVDDKWYSLRNIQSALKAGLISILDYQEQNPFSQEIKFIESYTNVYSLTKVEILNRADYPQDAFIKYNENFDRLDTVINTISASGGAWGTIVGDIENQLDLQIVLTQKADVSNVHSIPSGGTVGQVLKKQSNSNYDVYWGTGGGSTGATWGTIDGTLSNQTDLKIALDQKANVSGQVFTGEVSVPSLVVENSIAFSNVATVDSNIITLTASNTFAVVTINGQTFALPLYTGPF